MRKSFIFVSSSLLFLSLVFLFTNNTLSPALQEYISQEEYVPNELLVRFKKGVSKYLIQEAIDSIEGKIIPYSGKEIGTFQWDPDISSLRSFRLDSDLLHIKVPEFIGTELAVYLISQSPVVENVEKNTIYHFDEVPNDTDFGLLWGLHNTGQTGGTGDADTDAPEAWNIYTGGGTVVAVLDTGVDYNHEDLWQNIWINWQEYNGETGEDDDGNDLIDDYYGWDFFEPEGDNDPMDLCGHGTHVAGIIGAMGNNNKGVTGVNWGVKIMVLRVGDTAPHLSSKYAHHHEFLTESGQKQAVRTIKNLSRYFFGLNSYPLFYCVNSIVH